MCCLLGRMLHPKPYSSAPSETTQHVLGVRVQGCDSDVETMLTCVVPTGCWCHLPLHDNGHSHAQRIKKSQKAGGRLILANIRSWPLDAINKLLRLLQNSSHAKAMHCVLLLPENKLPARVWERKIKILPVDFTTLSHGHSQQLKQQQAAVLVKCNRSHL